MCDLVVHRSVQLVARNKYDTLSEMHEKITALFHAVVDSVVHQDARYNMELRSRSVQLVARNRKCRKRVK